MPFCITEVSPQVPQQIAAWMSSFDLSFAGEGSRVPRIEVGLSCFLKLFPVARGS
jgi:hypothetical protein